MGITYIIKFHITYCDVLRIVIREKEFDGIKGEVKKETLEY